MAKELCQQIVGYNGTGTHYELQQPGRHRAGKRQQNSLQNQTHRHMIPLHSRGGRRRKDSCKLYFNSQKHHGHFHEVASQTKIRNLC